MEQPYIIGIRFQKGGKVYHFDASHCRNLKSGDYVVVETARGRQLGEVIGIVESPKIQDGNLKTIQRKANPRDLVLRQIWQCKEVEAVVNCRKKAIELGLTDLKFVNAEFSFDGTRLTLMYNSDEGGNKPDLRNLRRAMSRFYPHSQIEMHPMGPRDVAKLLGGMGACGLEERCCTAYLSDFSPISIKMAKEQGISLTPTEITGICGRLRCCLAYEYEQYNEARKFLPKKNKRVLTPHGGGKVLEVLPLKGAVMVLLDNNVIHEYPADEIQLIDENGIPIAEKRVSIVGNIPDEEKVLSDEESTGTSISLVEKSLSADGKIDHQSLLPPHKKPSESKITGEHSLQTQQSSYHGSKLDQKISKKTPLVKKYISETQPKIKTGQIQKSTGNRSGRTRPLSKQRRHRDR